jgi:N-acetylglucosamine-6-phosphate deacetylase
MAATDSLDGEYLLGSVSVTVRDGLAMLTGGGTIAGSTLTQDVALRMAISQAAVTPSHAVAALTSTPARVLGMSHRLGLLAPGYVADAVILDGDWRVDQVWADGVLLA